MSFWFFPQYQTYFYAPITGISILSEPQILTENPLEKSQVHEIQKMKVKLNITRQDLVRAGYNHKRNNWTEQEDKKLLSLAKSENLNWNQIGKKMHNRNSKMCYSRYRRLCYETKKRWTSQEESIILESIEKIGFNWKKIAELISGRTARQIQQHFNFCLRPDINKAEWTIEQDLLLIDLLENYGTNWKKLEEQLKGRSQNQIKNRYFGRLLKISAQKLKFHALNSPGTSNQI